MADIFQITLKDVRVIENGQIKEDVVGVCPADKFLGKLVFGVDESPYPGKSRDFPLEDFLVPLMDCRDYIAAFLKTLCCQVR